jgi:type IV pilus assembly protein PilC
MHRAGIPWNRALESAAGGDARFEEAQRALDRGAPLARALTGVLDPLDVALIEAGEKDGALERVLVEIAESHDEMRRSKTEALTGLMYPIALAHFGAILLPLPDLVQGNYGAALLWAALILVPTWLFILLVSRRGRAERRRRASGSEQPPVPRPFLGFWSSRVEAADARALSVLGRLYEAGVPVADAVELSIASGWGGRAAADLAEARRRVARGHDLGGAWRHLPDDIADRLRSGEEAGSLGDALGRVAAELRFSVRTRQKRLSVLLPLLVMLVVGGIIALRILTFYVDLYAGLGR